MATAEEISSGTVKAEWIKQYTAASINCLHNYIFGRCKNLNCKTGVRLKYHHVLTGNIISLWNKLHDWITGADNNDDGDQESDLMDTGGGTGAAGMGAESVVGTKSFTRSADANKMLRLLRAEFSRGPPIIGVCIPAEKVAIIKRNLLMDATRDNPWTTTTVLEARLALCNPDNMHGLLTALRRAALIHGNEAEWLSVDTLYEFVASLDSDHGSTSSTRRRSSALNSLITLSFPPNEDGLQALRGFLVSMAACRGGLIVPQNQLASATNALVGTQSSIGTGGMTGLSNMKFHLNCNTMNNENVTQQFMSDIVLAVRHEYRRILHELNMIALHNNPNIGGGSVNSGSTFTTTAGGLGSHVGYYKNASRQDDFDVNAMATHRGQQHLHPQSHLQQHMHPSAYDNGIIGSTHSSSAAMSNNDGMDTEHQHHNSKNNNSNNHQLYHTNSTAAPSVFGAANDISSTTASGTVNRSTFSSMGGLEVPATNSSSSSSVSDNLQQQQHFFTRIQEPHMLQHQLQHKHHQQKRFLDFSQKHRPGKRTAPTDDAATKTSINDDAQQRPQHEGHRRTIPRLHQQHNHKAAVAASSFQNTSDLWSRVLDTSAADVQPPTAISATTSQGSSAGGALNFLQEFVNADLHDVITDDSMIVSSTAHGDGHQPAATRYVNTTNSSAALVQRGVAIGQDTRSNMQSSASLWGADLFTVGGTSVQPVVLTSEDEE
eukprot:Lankesteria_metandrocarpae@DN1901_c0_g1_i1.p1